MFTNSVAAKHFCKAFSLTLVILRVLFSHLLLMVNNNKIFDTLAFTHTHFVRIGSATSLSGPRFISWRRPNRTAFIFITALRPDLLRANVIIEPLPTNLYLGLSLFTQQLLYK